MTRNAHQHKALELLASGFAQDLANFIMADERYIDVMNECVIDFVDANIPFTDGQDKVDLAFMLMDKVYLKS